MQTVAVAVALELWRAADSFHVLDTSVTLCFVSTVEAFAFFTITVIFGTTAIAAVPIARLSVVLVVTVAVTLPFLRTTIGSFGRGRRWWHVIRVQTIALLGGEVKK